LLEFSSFKEVIVLATLKPVPERERKLIEQMFESEPGLAEDLLVEHLFCTYIVNLLEDAGFEWRGQSLRDQGWCVLLVMKVTRSGVPLVAFVSERNTTGCMRVFLRKLEEGAVNWQKDKFAGT
jgi:hypothetical protein